MAELGKQLRPYCNVSIFDARQTRVDVLLLPVRFGVGEDAIEIRLVRLVLPVVLVRVNVYRMIIARIGFGAGGRARFQRGRHASISPREGAFAPLATLELASLSYPTEPQRSKQ